MGELTITFSCDPEASHRLVDMALSEFEKLQVSRAPLCLEINASLMHALVDKYLSGLKS